MTLDGNDRTTETQTTGTEETPMAADTSGTAAETSETQSSSGLGVFSLTRPLGTLPVSLEMDVLLN